MSDSATALAAAWATAKGMPKINWDAFACDRKLLEEGKVLEVPHFRAIKSAFDLIKPKKGHKVLEVGACSGYYSEVFKALKIPVKYTALDCSEAAKKFASEKCPDVPYIIGDASDMPVPDGSYGTVISGYVMLHVADWKLHIAECARASREWVILHRVITHEGNGVLRGKANIYEMECLLNIFSVNEVLAGVKEAGLHVAATLSLGGSGGYGCYTFVCSKKDISDREARQKACLADVQAALTEHSCELTTRIVANVGQDGVTRYTGQVFMVANDKTLTKRS